MAEEERGTYLLTVPEQSDWECGLFGSDFFVNGLVYIPAKGNEPNWFWRLMQYLIFGNRWRRRAVAFAE